MPAVQPAERKAWNKYLRTLRHDTMPKNAEGYQHQYEQVELFAWARLQEELERLEAKRG